jgi:hypothetical protein
MNKTLLVVFLCLAGCASAPPPLPYPAFISVDELPDAFVASLPGVRAKQLSIDPRTQRVSYRLAIPADWSGTTGGSPIHSMEIYVIAGAVEVGEFELTAGGYAYLPAGMSGAGMTSDSGAIILAFFDEADSRAVIQTPIITNSELLEWTNSDIGVSVKDLRYDPGSGARTWLVRITPDAILNWQKSSRLVEGYLVEGSLTTSECSGGMPVTDDYLAGGYFNRPPDAVSGGPETVTVSGATWYLRVSGENVTEQVDGCPQSEAEAG